MREIKFEAFFPRHKIGCENIPGNQKTPFFVDNPNLLQKFLRRDEMQDRGFANEKKIKERVGVGQRGFDYKKHARHWVKAFLNNPHEGRESSVRQKRRMNGGRKG